MRSKIFGYAYIDGNKVVTHCDTHILTNITTISVRREFMGGSITLSGALAGYGLTFADLLYFHEILFLVGISGLIAYAGSQWARLTLLSRDLRGSELANAVWGYHKELQAKRHEIADAVVKSGGRHVS